MTSGVARQQEAEKPQGLRTRFRNESGPKTADKERTPWCGGARIERWSRRDSYREDGYEQRLCASLLRGLATTEQFLAGRREDEDEPQMGLP